MKKIFNFLKYWLQNKTNICCKIVTLVNKLDNKQLQELEDYFRELRLYKERNNKCECGMFNSCTTNGSTCAKCGKILND